MATMKKLMEGWRGYEKHVLNEQRAKKPADRILAELGPDQSMPYYPAGNAPKPSATATKVFDTAADAASSLGRLNRLGIPTKEEIDDMRNMSSAELSVYNMTYDDLDALETMDWSDIIIDFDDPVDISANAALGGLALSGFGTAGGTTVAAGGAKAAMMAKRAASMAKTIKAIGYVKKAKKAKGVYGAGKSAIAANRVPTPEEIANVDLPALTNTGKPVKSAAKDWSSDSTVQNIAALDPVPGSDTYVVAAGDSMSNIGKDRGYSVEDMIAANPQIKDPNEIEIDQKINLPTDSPA